MSSLLNRMQMDDFCAWNGMDNKGGYEDKWRENTALQVTLQVMLNSKSTFQTDRSAVTTAQV